MDRYGLAVSPFASRADAGFVRVASRSQPLCRLAASLRDAQGIALLTAAPGLGKTALCRELAREFRQEGWLVALLPGAGLTTRRSLLQAILYELGLPYIGLTEQEARLRLLQTIRDRQPQAPALLLLVDEAQRLSDRLLEELRALSNHEQDGRPLVHVLLSGDLSLEERLLEPSLSAVHQRIACHETLLPLSLEESARFLDERIMQAGGDGWEHVFTPTAMELICLVSDGCLRNLEQLAHRSLVIADAAGEPRVTVNSVRRALEELRELPLQWNEPSNLDAYSAREQAEASADARLGSCPGNPQEATMTSRPQSCSEDLRTEDAVAVIVGDELPAAATLTVPPLVGAASIEVGGAASAGSSEGAGASVGEPAAAPSPLDDLFTRGLVEAHALLDEFDSPGLADTAILTVEGEGMSAATDEHTQTRVMPASTDAVPAWLELEVDDRYAALDAARGGLMAPGASLPPVLRDEPAAAVGSVGEIERRLLFEVRELAGEIAAASPPPAVSSPLERPEQASGDTEEAREAGIVPCPGLGGLPPWDVIQPEWLSEQPFEPVELEPWTPRKSAPLSAALPSKEDPSLKVAQSPDEGEDAPRTEGGISAPVIRVDPPSDRPYAQLFSRLRRLRASVGERLSAAMWRD